MKYSLFVFVLMGALFFSSCNDASEFEDDKALKSELREGDVMSKKDCFGFEFPIGIVFPDKDVKRVDDEEEFYSTIKKWYKANPKEKEKPSLEYPVQLIFKGEISKSINSEKEMIEVKKYCDKKEGDFKGNDCFSVVYPSSYEMPNGDIVSGEDLKELIIAVKKWYKSHPDTKEKPIRVYPLDIILPDGSIKTMNSREELIEFKKGC